MQSDDQPFFTLRLPPELLVPSEVAPPAPAPLRPVRLRCRLGIHAWGPWVDEVDVFKDRSNMIHQRRRCVCCNETDRSLAR